MHLISVISGEECTVIVVYSFTVMNLCSSLCSSCVIYQYICTVHNWTVELNQYSVSSIAHDITFIFTTGQYCSNCSNNGYSRIRDKEFSLSNYALIRFR